MDTEDDYFVATGGTDYGFSNIDGYSYGVYTYGRRAGVYGQLGQADGPDTNNFSVLVGVVGTSQDGVGARGTSTNSAGVYGQNGFFSGAAPQPFPSGVCGMSEGEPGVTAGRERATASRVRRGPGLALVAIQCLAPALSAYRAPSPA